MFIPFGNASPLRHRAYPENDTLREFLTSNPPHSVFYSTAYWQRPHEYKMADKGWLGADLIFDLDGDHLPGVTDRDFPGMLSVIHEQAWALWNDFLQPEFGFDQKYLQVTFSGHRGFHLHYRDPAILHLDSEARRELVSHIRGEGVEVQTLMPRYNDSSAQGWNLRLRKGVKTMAEKLRRISDGSPDELKELMAGLKKMYEREGVANPRGKTSVKRLAKLLADDSRFERVVKGRFQGLNQFEKLFLDLVKCDASIVLGNAGETDEVVTIDVRRQIRFPSSLHGKCGLKVTEFPLSRLDPDSGNPFDPLSEAIVFSSQDSYRVEITSDDVVARFHERTIEATTGDIIEVHEAGATFFVLKGWGHIISSANGGKSVPSDENVQV
jgi:DNA primase small subunit